MSSSDIVVKGSVISVAERMGGGWRMARAAHGFPCAGVFEGVYFEFCRTTRDGSARCGWSRSDANVETNVGFDKFSFGIRDVDGSFFHESKGRPLGEAWGVGDVIGCLMWQTGGDEFGMSFFRNGVAMSQDELRAPAGIYYPSVSLFGAACGTVELGPSFAFPPSNAMKWIGAHALDGTTLVKVLEPSNNNNHHESGSGQQQQSSAEEASADTKRSRKESPSDHQQGKRLKPSQEGEGGDGGSGQDAKMRSVTEDGILNVSLAKTSFWKD
jgi:hypothetical protein